MFLYFIYKYVLRAYKYRFYPSSKVCNSCDVKNTKLQLKDRDETLNRDLNESLNILDEGIKITGLGKPVVPVKTLTRW